MIKYEAETSYKLLNLSPLNFRDFLIVYSNDNLRWVVQTAEVSVLKIPNAHNVRPWSYHKNYTQSAQQIQIMFSTVVACDIVVKYSVKSK